MNSKQKCTFFVFEKAFQDVSLLLKLSKRPQNFLVINGLVHLLVLSFRRNESRESNGPSKGVWVGRVKKWTE